MITRLCLISNTDLIIIKKTRSQIFYNYFESHYYYLLSFSDVRDLQSKLATFCFDEEENVILEIEPLPPSYSCLIKSNKSLKTNSVKWHCNNHAGGDIMIHKNNDDMEYIVTFNSKTR